MTSKEKADTIAKDLLDAEGNMKLLRFADYDQFDDESLRLFCHFYARYLLPTTELVDFLKNRIAGKAAIEIGAGCGDLGRHLEITMTDSYCQEFPEVKAYYDMLQQPTIKYGEDVEKLDALGAIDKYGPDIVIGAWVTQWIDPDLPFPEGGGSEFGVKESELLKKIDRYIVIGSQAIHSNKKILELPHETIDASNFVRSRRKDNVIMIW